MSVSLVNSDAIHIPLEDESVQIVPCTILDPFVGSGTTLLAARNLGRTGIGLDLSFHYLNNDAKNRLGIAKKDQWEQKAEVIIEENQKTMFD